MQRRFVCLSILLVLIGCFLPICAQQGAFETAPAMIRYTGTLVSSDGHPLRGTVGVNFYLYVEQEGGAPLWMEPQNVQADKSGQYSVMLGSASAHGMPAEVFIGGGARWLSVQASGQAEQPRTLLFSLPYGAPAMPSMQANQRQGENPGPQALQKLPPTVHGNGVVNFIPVWNDTKVIGESAIAQSGSNVGIGTTSAATTLDVFSSSQGIHAPIAQFGSKGATDSNSILTYNGTGTTEMFQSGCANCFIPLAQAGDGGMRVSPGKSLFLGDSGTARLRLDSAGNAEQPRTAGGMVKAMMLYNGFTATVAECFNSTLSGSAASKPPCGFTSDKTGVGDYIIDLGFQVQDRFFSLSDAVADFGSTIPNELNALTHLTSRIHELTPNQAEVLTEHDGSFLDTTFWLIVY